MSTNYRVDEFSLNLDWILGLWFYRFVFFSYSSYGWISTQYMFLDWMCEQIIQYSIFHVSGLSPWSQPQMNARQGSSTSSWYIYYVISVQHCSNVDDVLAFIFILPQACWLQLCYRIAKVIQPYPAIHRVSGSALWMHCLLRYRLPGWLQLLG
jgi:hypothetical protein